MSKAKEAEEKIPGYMEASEHLIKHLNGIEGLMEDIRPQGLITGLNATFYQKVLTNAASMSKYSVPCN